MHDYKTHAMQHIEAARAVWVDIRKDFRAYFLFGQEAMTRRSFGAILYTEPKPTVMTQPIDDDVVYIAAMHEVGHRMMNHQPLAEEMRWDIRLRMRITALVEAQAWKWAFDNALPVSQAAVDEANEAFGQYLKVFGWGDATPADLPDVMAAHFDRQAVAA